MASSTGGESRGMRLDAWLARAGLASRREARGLIRRGAVTVEGEICRDPARHVRDEVVRLEEALVESPAEGRDFLLHKPIGYACSRDERESPRVFDLLEADVPRRRDLLIAGRLDRATSGLLVLTTDGDLVHRLTHPGRKLPKRYRVGFDGELAADAVPRARAGLLLAGDERPTRPAELVIEGPGRATLVLREGRTHQVRRMFRALGAEVTTLHRDRVGDLDLPADLAPGALRPLSEADRERLLAEPGSSESSL
ncbi:MAG: pseudouridine synthase [Myxococcota bacterium]|nr:rRNA pseudouridine synthase [Myxococcales bacterium]